MSQLINLDGFLFKKEYNKLVFNCYFCLFPIIFLVERIELFCRMLIHQLEAGNHFNYKCINLVLLLIDKRFQVVFGDSRSLIHHRSMKGSTINIYA